MANILNKNSTDSAARYVSATGDPQHAGFKLTRAWERMDALAVDAVTVALNDCTFYTNPQADHQTYTGRFIQSSLDPVVRQDDSIDIRQTLTKTKQAVAEADADIVSQTGDPKVSGYELSRAWHYIDPYSLDTLFPVVLNDSFVTNPLGNTDSLAGKFVVSRVRSVEQTDRTYDIIQDMVKVKAIDSVGDLTDPLIDRAKDIIHPFGEGTGVSRGIIYRYLNLDPASDTKLMALSDTELVARMSQNDSFIHVSRKSTTETNRTLSFWILAERKQRIAWGGRFDTPDHIEEQNVGRDGTMRVKRWFGIDNDCYAGVKARLESDTDTDYSIISANLRDNDDGSDDWTQTLIKHFNDTQTDSRIINTHGIQHNGISIIHHRFDNYTSEPATPALSGGYKYESEKVWMDERGLISKRVITSRPDPSNANADSSVITSIAFDDHAELSGANRRETWVYDQVPIGSAESAVDLLANGNDSNIVTGVSYTDIGNGAARIDRDWKRVNAGIGSFTAEVSSSNNGGMQSVRRTWPLVKDSDAVTLMGGAAISSFTYDTDSYIHIRANRTKHYDGTSTVTQLGATAASLINTGGGAIWVGGTSDSELSYQYMSEVGLQEEIITYQKSFKTFASAIAFVDGGDDFITQGGLQKLGRVDLQGSGSWLAKKVVRVI